ncbi:MAG: hypothetical protein KIS66_05350 [Fimbriimonadaceae bacterium]|nr:hypothetical protein [Fimbriimonadaceae bacterium]
MKRQDLAFVADALLTLCERDRDAPHYTERAFEGKLAVAHRREPRLAHLAMGRGGHPLLCSEIEAILVDAGLTDRQKTVFRLRAQGRTFEEIGRLGGHTKQGAQSIFSQAKKKLERAQDVYPYRGLSEVYHDEVRRGRRTGGARSLIGVGRI